MTDLLAGAKPKKKVEKPSATVLAFREYERVSWYLATQGDFNFAMDTEAREMLWDFNGDDMSADINLLTANRIDPDENVPAHKIPKGDHIDGLAVRTQELERVRGKRKPEKQAAVKTPKVEKLAATPNMKRLLKKKGATSVDEAGELLA